ncbi:LLM class flavin-dependent oxidoreductase [Spirosoma utsteinense]|uniref:Luciferase family oxidoreductase group 1 n=1 Tax=Spirosoma utsteinense TaxID=2585773 RepID=A0ABR6W5Z3_9BACT|nr:LLM class flavin-dependent oxidoreductase [Spirosoma utsteinense]MBC3785836.1 luciferase family oxidoreductase group 1 [Spirosoma utsteinense]MBC3792008.1 luciferase family oxidoreductase group 1 [Spirosoma utsteinense]
MIPFSILDLSPIVEGNTATQALRNTLNLAQHAEQLGYNRYWVAEHHNMPGIASAATSVVIGYVAGGTQTIRVGSGGIMLPNHSPLLIAEQFGTLESLYPGRIDLGLGRAPGADQATARALRRDMTGADTFPQDVVELQRYFQPDDSNQFIQAVPGTGLNVPIWILGSSLFGAQLAAMLGLPYAFASHFAPAELLRALHMYRTHFKPSAQLKEPYAMVAVNVVAADTDAEAERLFTSVQQQFLYIRRGKARQMQPPVDNLRANWPENELAAMDPMLRCSAVGSPDTIQRGLASFIDQTQANELIISAPVFDHQARKHSLTLTAQVRDALAAQETELATV